MNDPLLPSLSNQDLYTLILKELEDTEVYDEEEIEKYIEKCNVLLSLKPESFEPYYLLLNVISSIEKVEIILQKLLKRDSNKNNVYYQVGKKFLDYGEYKKAEYCFKQCKALNQSSQYQIKVKLALIYLRTNRINKSAKLLIELLGETKIVDHNLREVLEEFDMTNKNEKYKTIITNYYIQELLDKAKNKSINTLYTSILCLKEALTLDPSNVEVNKLLKDYEEQYKQSQIQDCLKKIEANLRSFIGYDFNKDYFIQVLEQIEKIKTE